MDRRELVEVLAYAGLTPADMSRLRPEHVTPGRRFLPGPHNKGTNYGSALAILDHARATSLRDECIIGAGMFMGLRQVEMRRANVEDLSDSTSGLYIEVIGKGGKRRRVYVPESLAARVRQLASLVQSKLPKASKPTPKVHPLFQSSQGRLSARGISGVINSHISAAGVEITPHGLRHSFVTWLLNSGATLEEAMEIVGHSTVSSHEIYAAAGESWIWNTWTRCHPLAARGGGEGSVYIPGEPYPGTMAEGVERVVPLPGALVQSIFAGLGEHKDYLKDPRRISQDMYRAGRRAPLAIREDAAIQMAENGAHPFFMSLVLGITPDSVIAARFDRRGPLAEQARIAAINCAVAPLIERKENVA